MKMCWQQDPDDRPTFAAARLFKRSLIEVGVTTPRRRTATATTTMNIFPFMLETQIQNKYTNIFNLFKITERSFLFFQK